MSLARRLFVLTLLVVCCSVAAVRAQDHDAGDWFLAWNVSTGALVSFTPDGETHTLIETGLTGDFWSWYMDDGSVLAVVELDAEGIDAGHVLYHLTRTSATPITLSPEDDAWLAETRNPSLLAHSGAYAVLVAADRVPSGSAILVNLDTHAARSLEQQVIFTPVRTAAFSADGLYLRYVGRAQDDQPWTLREHKLETADERVFYTVEDDAFPIFTADRYGERWLYTRRSLSHLISRSGEVETTEYGAPEQVLVRHFFGDYLVTSPIICQDGCALEWTRLSDGVTTTFPLPALESGPPPGLIAQVGDSALLALLDGDALWLLSTDDDPLYLGNWSPQTVVTRPEHILSPDGRWLLALDASDDDAGYQVWDLHNREVILRSDPERDYRLLQITYGYGGFILAENTRHFQYYHPHDARVIDLGEPGGIYSAILSDGALLFMQYAAGEERARGIYHYHPETGDYTLLVENGMLLRPAPPPR